MFRDSDVVRASIAAGSGQYLGTDALVCGVYVAKDDTEHSYIQFRRGKDASSEAAYKIGWEKSSDPETMVRLIASKIDEHQPDITFIAESGLAGIITDRIVYLGYNAAHANLQLESDEPLKYHDKMAETHQKLRTWLTGGGSVFASAELEQSLCSITYEHDNKDRLAIDVSNPWSSALALTFFYPVSPRAVERGKLDMSVANRQKGADYNPLDAM